MNVIVFLMAWERMFVRLPAGNLPIVQLDDNIGIDGFRPLTLLVTCIRSLQRYEACNQFRMESTYSRILMMMIS